MTSTTSFTNKRRPNSMQAKFDEARKRARYLRQYMCCRKRWWGGPNNNKCFGCSALVVALPHEERVGLGWFRCTTCHRLFAGFISGDATSPCRGCHAQLRPLVIGPGLRADREDKDEGKGSHNCSRCNGGYDCPVVFRKRVRSLLPRLTESRAVGVIVSVVVVVVPTTTSETYASMLH